MNRETTKKYDSEFCGNLPIHLINVIQPYAAMLVIDKATDKILQVSENCAALLNRPLNELPGAKASTYIDIRNVARDKSNLPQVLNVRGKTYLGIYHEYATYYIIEVNLESKDENIASSFIDVYHELKDAMSAMESTMHVMDMLKVAAEELKKASGFDKVMIYKFDENWNGHVLAEVSESDMESYIGVTFPASDIPKPARDLYLKNAYRFIPDRHYVPVKMYPVINPVTNSFLDMSDCNSRGVTTVHLEYLKNMGVTASMSTRILKDGKLWGLIACHHKTAMHMNYKLCTVFELLSNIISAKISTLQSQENHEFQTAIAGKYTSLVEETYRSSKLIDSLLHQDNNILEIFNAQGAVVNVNGHTFHRGTVPDTHDLEDIILWLNSKDDDNIYYTNNLSRDYDYADEFKEVASGMMAIPVNATRDEYILLFRPEVLQVINWGGDPESRIKFEPDMKTYHPRHSFKIWQETVTGISQPWKEIEVSMATNLKDFVKAFLDGKNYTYRN
jgi:light-regulated signal transduction histidine kinase (bacteriophytochrome)